MKPVLLSTIILMTFATVEAQRSNNNQYHEDPHSFALPAVAVVQHLELDINVDFTKKIISGVASWTVKTGNNAKEIVFDTRNLKISKVTSGERNNEKEAKFNVGKQDKQLGSPLTVTLTGNETLIHIYYETNPYAAALQWLSPQQTAGKKHPFLFTQSQAILARTWLPCQDSPGIRYTYNATVKVPKGLIALMSAENPQEKNETGIYHFSMKQPVPSYLMALAAGNIVFESIGPRTGVYAEPEVIEAAAYEFADMEKMLVETEKLYGPYLWDRYDLIVLPPSFPFGGMENPRLTFATPTILAGDRSLTALVAHELAHSWSGNLVTNANWNDFWLNEGFTVYLERRIMEALYGKAYAEMLALLGYQDLMETVKEMGETNPDTKLKLDLAGRDPDEGLTEIAYEKGYFLLRLIEETYGREPFDKFLRDYFKEFAFKPVTTEMFVAHLSTWQGLNSDATKEANVNAKKWIYEPGIPENIPQIKSMRFEFVEKVIQSWEKGNDIAPLAKKNWSTHEWLHFIRHLPDTMTTEQMAQLDRMFDFTNSGNSEIQAAWFEHVIKHKYEPAYPQLEAFLVSVGRRKFLKPLYQRLAATPEGKTMALRIYEKGRPNYHSVSTNTLDEILGWNRR
jgi:leukotriene-A4 hydrolase